MGEKFCLAVNAHGTEEWHGRKWTNGIVPNMPLLRFGSCKLVNVAVGLGLWWLTDYLASRHFEKMTG